MVPISLAGMKEFVLKVCVYCSTLSVLCARQAIYSCPASWTNTTGYTNPSVAHMDQNDKQEEDEEGEKGEDKEEEMEKKMKKQEKMKKKSKDNSEKKNKEKKKLV